MWILIMYDDKGECCRMIGPFETDGDAVEAVACPHLSNWEVWELEEHEKGAVYA